MDWNWLGRGLVACMVGAILAGCATADRPTTLKKDKFKDCEYEYDYEADGKVKKGSLKVKPGVEKCEARDDFKDAIYVGDSPGTVEKVIEIGAVQIKLPGSCKICWVNTNGGLTCVWYGGSC